MNLLSLKAYLSAEDMGSVGVPREKIASGGGRNLRLLPKFCTLRSQNLQINLSVKKIDKTICKPIDASFRKTKTCEGAVQKEMGSLNYFKFTSEFKSAKI